MFFLEFLINIFSLYVTHDMCMKNYKETYHVHMIFSYIYISYI
jgi:hypothetical protein